MKGHFKRDCCGNLVKKGRAKMNHLRDKKGTRDLYKEDLFLVMEMILGVK